MDERPNAAPARLKAAVNHVLRGLGCELVRARPLAPTGARPYEQVRPWANYAPWNADAEFQAAFAAVKSHTLVDFYRCWELWKAVEQSAKLSGAILEVGVWRGGTGAIMARKAALCGIKEPVYLCDTFAGVVKAGGQDSQYKGGEHSDTSLDIVSRLVEQTMRLTNVRILQGIFPDATAARIDPDQTFRLCHIDVDVYESARDVLAWVWPRLAAYGQVIFDDYGFDGCGGVTKLVDELASSRDRVVIHNLNGHALMIKLPEQPPVA